MRRTVGRSAMAGGRPPMAAAALAQAMLLWSVAEGWHGGGDDSSWWYRSRRTGRVQFAGRSAPPPPPPGTFFSATITDKGVLQRGTSAAMYGVVVGSTVRATTVVKVTVTDESAGSMDSTVVMARLATVWPGHNVTWKALLPPRADYGGNLTITAACVSGGCPAVNASATVRELVYGDVWFCSGQSNMELPMQHALTRNRTYAALDLRGEYQNIRTFKHGDHDARFDGDEVYVLPPPPPTTFDRRTGIPTTFYGWQQPNSSTVDEFSAACWFFAQELTDMALAANKTAPVLGLIQSAWGGTEIDDWIQNSSISACKNASGYPEPNRQGPHGAVYPDNGALNNGMVAPFLNYTIFGVLWYQGENNVHECLTPPGSRGRDGDMGPASCGNVLNSTGYACSQRNLVVSWRRQWSATPGTTKPDFPFGIVSLAAGTSEGNSQNMANFRLAQTASYGFLPAPQGSGMERTFIAQAYDAGDPGVRSSNYGPRSQIDAPFQSSYDMPYPGRVGYTGGGHQMFTPQYMGGLHPRAKQTIGRRLALAAAAVAYGDATVPFTGPVLESCTIWPEGQVCPPDQPCTRGHDEFRQRQITINFRKDLLGNDAVKVWPTTPDTEGLTVTAMYQCLNGTCLASCGVNATCVHHCAVLQLPHCRGWASTPVGPAGNGYNPAQYTATHFHFSTGRVVSPLEVQLNGTLWMPAAISFNAAQAQGSPLGKNFSRVLGWQSVIATAPTAIPLGCSTNCPHLSGDRGSKWCIPCTATFKITGVRYAWAESPCCGGNLDTAVIPCPVNSCPISTVNSTLPAVPFSASVVMSNDTSAGIGHCSCPAPQRCS